MKKIGFALGLAALAVMATILWAPAAGATDRPPVLHVYTWSDYLDSEVIRLFEEANNCRVSIDYFDSNESMYAKLKAGGGGYDVITPSSYMSTIMRNQAMLLPLNHEALTNLKYIDRHFTSFTEDPDMKYGVPYTRTVTGVGYNKASVAEGDLGGWDIFANAKYAKRMTMLNDMRETIGAALKHLGHSLNTTDEKELGEAEALLVRWKKNLAKFDVDEAKFGLGSGEFFVIHAYNGDVALVMQENPDIGFYIPREGSSLASDDFVIAADTPVPDLAHAFVNHLMDPEVAAINMESIRYFMPNPEAVKLLSDELRDNPAFNVSDKAIDTCEVIKDLGADNAKYIRVWDKVKAAE